MYNNLEVFMSENLSVGECPTWDEKKKVFYNVDIRGKCYYATDYASGVYKKTDVPQLLGCMALCDDDDIILSMEDGIYFINSEGVITPAHTPCKIKGQRFNDGKVGADGAYYVGTADDKGNGAFYRLSNDALTELFDGCGCSNGLDWNANSDKLYYCDSRKQKIEVFDFSLNKHNISNRRTIITLAESDGSFDGMTIDAAGNLWVAVWGGWCVLNINPNTGRIIKKIELPVKQVSSCCFGGEDMKDLIITTAAVRTDLKEQPHAGNIFVYRSDVPGVYIKRYKKTNGKVNYIGEEK